MDQSADIIRACGRMSRAQTGRTYLWTAPTCEGLLCSLAPQSPAGIYPVFSTLMESATRSPNI